MLVASAASQGNDIVARNAVLSPSEDGYTLTADFTVNLNARLDEAIARGIALYFVIEFELTRSRWYWLDEQVVSRSQTFQLSYHALTRQYRLYSGALHQSFTSLDDALRIMSRVRNWQVIDKNQLRPDQSYQAAVRMRLDLSQMPKTFQVNALANRDWSLSSEWVRWAVMAADSTPAPGSSGSSPAAGPVEAR